MKARDNAIIPVVPTADQRGEKGKFITAAGAIMANATTVPFGVILDGGNIDGESSVAISAGGFSGTVRVKLAATAGTVVRGTFLTLDATTLGAVRADPGTGNRVQVAQALEAGANHELIEAVLIRPTVLS